MAAVNHMLGINHVFGAAFHPQSQGYIEGRRQSINSTLRAYAQRFPGRWALYARLAQWAMRATPRSDRGGKSPFELVTGLLPQGPLDHLFRKLNDKVVDPAGYVAGL